MQKSWNENNTKTVEKHVSEILLELTKVFFAKHNISLNKLCYETIKFLFFEGIDHQNHKNEKW